MMDGPIPLILAALLGYFLGSIPFGLVLTRYVGGIDLRTVGSGNIGATNVLRTGRKDLALATLVLDSGKAAIALMIARSVFGDVAGLTAGAAAFVGHCYPVWLKFNGGKGVATFFGLLLAGLPMVGIAAGATWILTALAFRFSSLGALAAASIAPVIAYFLADPALAQIEAGFCVFLAALIFWRHRGNIQRLATGQEPRIGAKAALSEPATAPEPPRE